MSAAAPRRDLPVSIGQVIAGRYVVSGVLGEGGMGIVFSGRHLELGERVAIKFLNKEHIAHAERFFREARAAARIRGEHVVRIYDVGRLAGGEPYIVMEHLEGSDLADRLEQQGPLPLEQAAEILVDVCHALAEAHATGIVHRDLKPANIFLAKGPDGDDLVKLLDFGVAKVPEAGVLTKTATVLGSPVYMSPEQLMASREVDARSDIWSLGIVLYELLTNDRPFHGNSLVELGIIVREKPTPSVRVSAPTLPEAVDAVIGRCLAKDRADRYADVADLAEALAPFVSPGVAHSIGKVRRILDQRKRAVALASTMPPPLEETAGDDVASVPTAIESPAASGSVLAGSLVAVSSAVGNIEPAVTGPRAATSSRRRWLAVVAVAVGLAIVIGVGLDVKPFAPSAASTETRTAVSASGSGEPSAVVTTPPVASTNGPVVTEPSTTVTTPSVATTASAAVTPSAQASPRPTRRPIVAAPPSPAASSTAAPQLPAVNCNPPYTLDENGVRRPKRECL